MPNLVGAAIHSYKVIRLPAPIRLKRDPHFNSCPFPRFRMNLKSTVQ